MTGSLSQYSSASGTKEAVRSGPHEIVFANGLETESFHPAQAALDTRQMAEVESLLPGAADGAYARRVLSRPEAAILGHAA